MIRKLVLAATLTAALATPCLAAFARFQLGYNPNVINYNIVTDGGATCNGDVQVVTRLVTMTSGSPILTVDSSTFAPGDVNKAIVLANFGPGGNTPLATTIQSYTSATQVTLAANAQTSRTNYSLEFGFGTDDEAFNLSTTPGYLKLYNLSSTPTAGSSLVFARYPVPTNGFISTTDLGDLYTTGLSYTFTAALADSDTTAISNSSTYVVNLHYR